MPPAFPAASQEVSCKSSSAIAPVRRSTSRTTTTRGGTRRPCRRSRCSATKTERCSRSIRRPMERCRVPGSRPLSRRDDEDGKPSQSDESSVLVRTPRCRPRSLSRQRQRRNHHRRRFLPDSVPRRPPRRPPHKGIPDRQAQLGSVRFARAAGPLSIRRGRSRSKESSRRGSPRAEGGSLAPTPTKEAKAVSRAPTLRTSHCSTRTPGSAITARRAPISPRRRVSPRATSSRSSTRCPIPPTLTGRARALPTFAAPLPARRSTAHPTRRSRSSKAKRDARGLDRTKLAPPRSARHEIDSKIDSICKRASLPRAEEPQPAPLTCCFPYPVTYAVRGGSQWIVNGSFTSFEHHLIPDPNAADSSTAACIESCDPDLKLLNGRAPRRSIPTSTRHATDAPSRAGLSDSSVFQKPVHSVRGLGSAEFTVEQKPICLQRDMAFTFQEVGGFTRCRRHSPPTRSSFRKGSPSFPASLSWPSPTQPRKGSILFDLRRIAPTQTIF